MRFPGTRNIRHLVRAAAVLPVIGLLAVVTSASAPGTAQAQPPEPARVDLKTADGRTIAGFWLDAHEPGRPAVLLLHNAGSNHFPYRALWERLLRLGVNVLAVDFRGHGASQRANPDIYEKLALRDESVYAAFILDAQAGLDFLTRLQKIPAGRIAIVGGEIGATVGFQAMAANPKLAGLVALSPQLISHRIDITPLLPKFGKRPLLIVSAKKLLADGPQPITQALQKTATVQLEVFPGAEVRGVEMLEQPAGVERYILIWVRTWLLGEKDPY